VTLDWDDCHYVLRGRERNLWGGVGSYQQWYLRNRSKGGSLKGDRRRETVDSKGSSWPETGTKGGGKVTETSVSSFPEGGKGGPGPTMVMAQRKKGS